MAAKLVPKKTRSKYYERVSSILDNDFLHDLSRCQEADHRRTNAFNFEKPSRARVRILTNLLQNVQFLPCDTDPEIVS
jgi:hypothetical protein